MIIVVIVNSCAYIANNNTNKPGYSTIASKCSSCHIIPDYGSLNNKLFNETVRLHKKRVRLTHAELENIRLFLVRETNQAKKLSK